MNRWTLTHLLGCLLAWQVTGCEERNAASDATLDRRPTEEREVVDDLASEPEAPPDVPAVLPDAAPDADVSLDGEDIAQDVPTDEGGAADGSDVAVDDGALGDAPIRIDGDRPLPMDGPVEGVDATTPDEGAIAFDVGDGCTVARFGGPYDAGAPCTPGRTRACACSGGRRGAELCESSGLWGYCVCTPVDAGIAVVDGQVIVPERPIPWIGRPRLLAPQSGMRVTSQRPTLRWMLPAGIARARVELCADRPCARMLAQQELRGDRWRPTTALPAGVVFWRVRGLDEAGAVRWTSATWEFGVRHRDLGVDTSYGALKDFNGDGYDDLVTPEGRRAILVYPGSARGIEAGRVLALESIGEDGPDLTGLIPQTGIGDFNGDGLADLAFGSASHSRVWVHLGSRNCTLARTGGVYRASFYPSMTDVTAALSAGDFNGDGYADLLVNSQRMQLHAGGPTGPGEVPSDFSELTSNVAAFVGDINGDGYQDILSQALGDSASRGGIPLLVFYGNPEGRLDFHVERLRHPNFDDLPVDLLIYFGFLLRWGDLNEDGYMDALVSTPGELYVYYGSPAGYSRIVSPRTTDLAFGTGVTSGFGAFTAHPVDVDGDGHAEVLTGYVFAPADVDTERNGPGLLYVFSQGSTPGLLSLMPTVTIAAQPGSNVFGRVSAPGDLNGDGYDDVVVGAYRGGPAMPVGCAYIYHGGGPNWWRTPVTTIDRRFAFQRGE